MIKCAILHSADEFLPMNFLNFADAIKQGSIFWSQRHKLLIFPTPNILQSVILFPNHVKPIYTPPGPFFYTFITPYPPFAFILSYFTS